MIGPPIALTTSSIAALDEVAAALGRKDAVIVVGLSGRGDKDMVTIATARGAGAKATAATALQAADAKEQLR